MTEPKIPPRPTGPHPTAERLHRATVAERSGSWTPADEEVFAHAASCAACSAELAHLEAFDRPEPLAAGAIEDAWLRFRDRRQEPAAAPPSLPAAATAATSTSATTATIVPFPSRSFPAPTVRPWRRAGWAAAAMLVLGLGFGFFLGTSTVQVAAPVPNATGPVPPALPPAGAAEPTLDGTRGGPLPVVVAAELAPTGPLDRVPTEIRFANPGHEPKRVLLFATDPPYQWQSPETTAERVEIPAEERAKLKAGVDYFWSVLDAEGESAAQTFRLREPKP